ncbi:MAG TPA: AzlC family ABC transporter permease [Verrucomicrobiae bacterium]|nr:AzlC family ABC transporter permease [Verrucomicrobiae bacterium]
MAPPAAPAEATRPILRDALGIAVASGAYAIAFGAISTAAGLTLPQTLVMSSVMFTGASQFAMVGVIGGGGSVWAGAFTAVLLGTRNAFYSLRLASLLQVRGRLRPLAAQFVLDETTAMAIARDDPRLGRYAFWATGVALFTFWNTGTLLGALATQAISDPKVFGLDAAVPAAFLALLAPRLRAREPFAIAVVAAVVAIAVLPFVPAGVPLLIVAVLVGLFGLLRP